MSINYRSSFTTRLYSMALAASAALPLAACATHSSVRLAPRGQSFEIAAPALYPETIEVNPLTNRFLVSSIREGAVYEVALDGSAKRLVHDDRLTSVLGIAVDANGGRLLVTNADLGASVKHSERGPKREAGVGVYELATGGLIRYVDLTPLLSEGEHLLNGLTLDDRGDAYVTDSFSPAIYKISAAGDATLFLTAEEFRGPGVNLNGIVYHPRGFLLVVQKSTGALYRIPLDAPESFERVALSQPFHGGDGLTLVGESSLVLVANKTPAHTSNATFVLRSDDRWRSARLVQSIPIGDHYPTTCTTLNGRLYLLSSHLDEWLGANETTRDAIVARGRRAQVQAFDAR